MSPTRLSSTLAAGLVASLAGPACARGVTTLYAFSGGADGAKPTSKLVGDAFGNVYGTTQFGGSIVSACGSIGCGTVFRLDSALKLTTLHTFTGPDGAEPQTGVSLIRGALYGSVYANVDGGTHDIVYRMNTDGSDYQIIHTFTDDQGLNPAGYLQPSINGGEIGVTQAGGATGLGTLYYIGPFGTFAVLHNFHGAIGVPVDLVADGAGHLFGSTTRGDAPAQAGAVYEYDEHSGQFTTLHSFLNQADGGFPRLGAVAPDGTIYGTSTDGASGQGVLFQLTPSHGTYAFSVTTPITSPAQINSVATPPSIQKNGTIVGQTSYGIFTYLAGTYAFHVVGSQEYMGVRGIPLVDSLTQPLLVKGHPGLLLNNSASLGPNDCTSLALYNGCGFIYAIGR